MKRKKIVAALCALVMVFGSSGGLPISGLRLFDTAVTASAVNDQYILTVRFTPSGDAANWDKAYCHYWENDSNGQLVPDHTTAWSGEEMTKDGSDWVLNTTSEWNPTGIIFDAGGDYAQTVDLDFVNSNGTATARNGGSYGTYTASINWKSGDCTVTYDSDTKTMTVTGNGAMADYGDNSTPWYAIRDDVQNIVIEEGVTGIGNYAFPDCGSIENITIPASVKSIGKSAFYSSGSNVKVTFVRPLSESTLTVADSAFYYMATPTYSVAVIIVFLRETARLNYLHIVVAN